MAAPGSKFAYSGTNYLVLGLLVEEVTGKPVGREIERRIARPLHLHDTSFVDGTQIPGRHAHAYVAPVHDGIIQQGAARDRSDVSASWAGAAGAVVSDADDLARFLRALLGGRLLPKRLLAAMAPPMPRARLSYGLGLAGFPEPCGVAWGHTGNVLGYVTAAWSTPSGSRQVVMMVNTYPLTPTLESTVQKALAHAFCS